jgi:hypothetical protein
MSIVDFQPAIRKGSHVIIVYYGESGCGKTLSAIKTARGLVGPNGRFAVLDTENERALVYAKEAGGWLHANLTPPFTPDRYIQSIKAAEDAGFECLVIDSGSHEWEGLGGILEMADGNGQRGLVKWAGPKAAHKRYVQALLQTRMHLIICLRAKEKMRQLTAADTLSPGRKVGDLISDGFVSIQDKRFIYEATVQIFLPNPQAKGAKRGIPTIEKCPQDLLGAFNETAQIGIDTGERIREWINGGAPVDHALERLRRCAEEAAGKGAESFRAFWKATSAADRGKLQPLMDNLRSIAIAADAERERQQQTAVQQDASGPDTSLDDPFGASSAQTKSGASAGFAVVSSDGEIKWAGGNPADFTEHLIQALVNAGSPGDLAALEMENSTDIARLAADQRARISKATHERRALFGKSDAAA